MLGGLGTTAALLLVQAVLLSAAVVSHSQSVRLLSTAPSDASPPEVATAAVDDAESPADESASSTAVALQPVCNGVPMTPDQASLQAWCAWAWA
jgi:hypothetical protein